MKKLLIFTFVAFLGIGITSCVSVVKPRPASQNIVYIKKAPSHHKVVYVKGQRYSFWKGKHYRKTSRGYVYVKI